MQKLARLNASALVLVIIAAFGCSPNAKDADDPNRPAVVKGPPVVLVSDTARPDTTEATRARLELARSQLQREYALLIAAAGFGDRRTVADIYEPDIVLHMPDSVYSGQVAAAAAIVSLVRRNSITQLRRESEVIRFLPDDVVSDSGTYVMVGRRGSSDEIVERGVYSARWRRHDNGARWTMVSDRFVPAGSSKAAQKTAPKASPKSAPAARRGEK